MRYKMVNTSDANDEEELSSENLSDAALEALEMLGWSICAVQGEDGEQDSEDEAPVEPPICKTCGKTIDEPPYGFSVAEGGPHHVRCMKPWP